MFENINIDLAGIDRTGQYTSGDRQVISITDLISEGPIYGLVDAQASIYLNDDRAAPFSQAGNSYSSTPAKVRLTSNSNSAVIVGGGSTPIVSATNGDKYLIVRGVHTVYVTATNGSTSDANGNVTATLTTNSNSSFFTNSMISSGSSDLSTLVPARLTVTAGTTSGSLVEGSIISRASQSVATFMPGAGSPQGLIVPIGQYFLQIDRIVKISSISGAVLTLDSNWGFPTTGSYQEYSFDVSGAIVSNADVMSQTQIKKYKSVTSQFRVGTLDQPPFTGYGGVGSTSITNSPAAGGTLERSNTYGGTQAPKELVGSSAAGFNLTAAQLQEVDETTLTISYPNGLYAVSGEGNDKHTYIQYKVEIAIKKPGSSSFGAYISLHNPLQHSALEKNAISFVTRIDLDQYRPFIDFKVKVSRISNHTGPGYKAPNETYHDWQNVSSSSLGTVTSVIKDILTYPFTSLAKTTFDTKQFQSVPTRSYHAKGLKVLVPSNYVTRDQSADGIANYKRNISNSAIESTYQDWDGSFAVDKVYTNNPAWVFYDILTNDRYGLGDFLKSTDIDKYSLYRIARYCDQMVPDGKGGEEPRFTANLYLTKAADAFKVIKDIATTFRSMIYFFDGQVTPVQDAPSGPVYNFTKANVKEGQFTYESTGSKTRINQVIVTWVNPDSNYKAEPLIVEDRLNIAETGKIISQNAVAMGATSEGQAMRYGRWKLWTAANQREVVTFSSALNSTFLIPGDIVNIQDADRYSVRLGGRISNTGSRTTSTIPLDSSVTLNSGSTYKLSAIFTEPAAFATSDVTIGGINYKVGDEIKQAFIDGDGDGGSSGNGTYTLQDIDTEQKAQNAKASASSAEALVLTWADTTRVETKEVATGAGTVSSLTIKTSGTDENNNTHTVFSSVPAADSIWVLQEEINNVTVAGSSKQYKILALQESSKGEITFSAVEHYDEKFAAVDIDFTTFSADTIYPKVTSDDIVPPPLDVFSTTMPKKGQVGEELLVSWVAPTNVGDLPGEYEHLLGFEITHDFPGLENPIRISDPKQRTWKVDGIEDGTYSVAVRTVNVLNNLSEAVRIGVTITDRYDESIPRIALGLPIGGTSSATTSLDSSGIFSFSKTVFGFRPPQASGAFFLNTSTNTNTYQLDISNLPTITWTAQAESGEFIEEHHYVVMQANTSANVMKLIKYKKDSSHNIPYWFDAGDGSETTGLASLTGSILPSSATKIKGSGTSFSTELTVGSLLVVGSEAALVSSIESDTVLYIDRPITIGSASSASTNNYHFDYTNHTVIARVYKTSSGNNMVSFLSLDTTLAQVLERSLYALVANGGSAPSYTASAGTYQNPAQGVGTGWGLSIPSLANNNDIIYVIKRVLTEDGEPPQEAQWSAASVYAQRVDGNPGASAKVVNLTADKYVIPYTVDGGDDDENTTITFTATSKNISGTKIYKFYVDNTIISGTNSNGGTQTSTSSSVTCPLPDASEPTNGQQKAIRVDVEQPSGTIIASDSISVYGVKDGEDAFTAVLTNDAHAIPALSTGAAKTYANSGTDIRVFRGSTPLTYATSGANTFSVTASASGLVSVGGDANAKIGNATTVQFAVANDTRRFAQLDANAMADATTSASITFTITARNQEGTATTITKVQTFTKGNDGANSAVDIIFRRSTNAPNPNPPAPSSGVPATSDGWSTTIPTNSTATLWASNGNKSGGSTNYTWSQAYKVEAKVVAELQIFSDVRANGGASPAVPSASKTNSVQSTYNFTDSSLTIGDADWNKSPPTLANNGDTVYVCNALVTAESPTETAAGITWGTPVVYSKKTDGITGVSLNLTASPVLFIKDGTTYDPGSTSTLSLSAFGGTITSVAWTDDVADTIGVLSATTGNSTNTFTFANDRTEAQIKDSVTLSAAVTGTTSDNTTGVSFGTITAKIPTSIQGADGATPAPATPGTNAPRTATGFVYSTQNSTAPSATNYNFSNNTFTSLNSNWSITPPTVSATQTTIYYSRYTSVETVTSNVLQGTGSVTFSGVGTGTNFSGLVTFSSGDFSDASGTITEIDGGNIKADSIAANKLTIGEEDRTGNRLLLLEQSLKIFQGNTLRVHIGDLSNNDT